jgi:hypothetical protein
MLDEREIDFVSPHALNLREPQLAAVAQLVKLARLGAQHSRQVRGGISAQFRRAIRESLDEKSPPHNRYVISAESGWRAAQRHITGLQT